MTRNVLIALIRNDLRIHDNQIFHAVHQASHRHISHLLPVYVYDERQLELSGLPGYQREGPEARTRVCGFWRMGSFRLRFTTEAIFDLQDRLRAAGSDLLIRYGKTEKVLASIVKALQENGDKVEGVYMQKETCTEEEAMEKGIEKLVKPLNVNVTYFRTKTLIHPDDLPFPVSQTPDVFTPFRKRVEALGEKLSRPTNTPPSKFKPFPSPIPTTTAYGAELDGEPVETILAHLLKPLEGNFGLDTNTDHSRDIKSAFPFKGGETAALERLDWYFKTGGNPPPVARYKQTRNNLLGHEYSTKISPFLAIGCVSPRLIMEVLDEHERKFGSNTNTYWVRFELLWRDYFLLVGEKFGSYLFKLGGFELITDKKQAEKKLPEWTPWDPNEPEDGPMRRWIAGRTGIPFIDANIVELQQSGFMSNRGRQNVASFLSKDMYIDWRVGAEFFESNLVDYEPCANYGNWQYVAGVGNDPRASRQFNPIKQGHDYDEKGQYIKHWIPILSKVPTYRIHTPWLLSEQEKYECGLDSTKYPARPLLEQESWKSHYDRNDRKRSKMYGNPSERVGGGGGSGGGGGTKRSGSVKGQGQSQKGSDGSNARGGSGSVAGGGRGRRGVQGQGSGDRW